MIYGTDCGCVASNPEPHPGEYRDRDAYFAAVADWRRDWERVSEQHTRTCPRSAWCEQSALADYYERESYERDLTAAERADWARLPDSAVIAACEARHAQTPRGWESVGY
jgi:hypothetical protein